MEEGEASLCHYCLKLFPIDYIGQSTRPFYSNLAIFLLNADNCPLCAFIQNHLGLDETIQHTSEVGPSYDSASIRLRLKESRRSEDGVRWAILEIMIRIPDPQGEINDIRIFSVTTCGKNCMVQYEL